MNEKLETLLKKIRASATVAGAYATKKASEIGEKTSDAFNIGKKNLKLFDLNTDMDVIYKEIGKIIYTSHSNEETETEKLEELLNQADEKMQEIAKLKEEIAQYNTTKKCPVCGNDCQSDAVFCSKCGTQF